MQTVRIEMLLKHLRSFSFSQYVPSCYLQIVKLMRTGYYKLLCQSDTLCITDLNFKYFYFTI